MPERGQARAGRRTALRLSLQFALLYAALSALVFVGAYMLSRYEARDWVEDRMRDDAGTLARLAEAEGSDALRDAVAALARMDFEAERIWRLTDADGTPLVGNVDGLPDDPPRYVSVEGLTLPPEAEDEASGYWTRRDEIGDLILIQGTSDHVVFEIVEALAVALGLGFVALMGAGIAAGVRVGRLTGDRVAAVSRALTAAAGGAMDARVPDRVARAPDEIGQVAAEVNAALAEIADLMEAQETVTAQVAHDLRTPMQRLRQRIERLDGIGEADREGLLADVDGILRTFRALLALAEISAQPALHAAAPLDLGQLLREVAETYEPVLEDAGMALALDLPEAGPSLRGDRDLLVQMAANLIENAVAHATGASHMTITASRDGGAAILRVADDGPGIPPEEAEAVFRRFHRLDPARRTGGAGLGLPLVRAIARLHGGEARIAPQEGGAAVEVRMVGGA